MQITLLRFNEPIKLGLISFQELQIPPDKPLEIPFPVQSPLEISQAILASVSTRTKLVVLDHVTSPTIEKLLVRQ